MRKNLFLSIFAALLCFSSLQAQNDNLFIIPAPNEIQRAEGQFTMGGEDKIYVLADCEESRTNAAILCGILKEDFGVEAVLCDRKAPRKAKTISFVKDLSCPAEGYELTVTPGQITARGTGAGLFYSIQTLRQMARAGASDAVSIPCAVIKDSPRFEYRGIMQDVGYHIYPVEFIKQEIDYLARYKMNVYHWHLTEDHGWRIESKKYPKLNTISSWRDQTCVSHYNDDFAGMDMTPYGGYYTQEQIREIVAYASERHVTVIPEIELPGHTLAVLAAYPELACGDNPGPFKVAQTWGIFPDVFCAGKEATFEFLEGVLDEVLELFPSEYIHIGGDECPKDRWSKCPHCQKRIKEEGLKDEFELQNWFVTRIEKYLNSKGRQIIGWDEILEGGLAPGATVMNWRDISEGIKAAKLHHNVVMSPNAHIYFDYIQGDRKQEPLAIGWGFNPTEHVYQFEPVPAALTKEESKYIIGVEAPLWTEHMDTYRKVSYMLYPRLFALSEVAWTRKEAKNLEEFMGERLPKHIGWLDESGIVYRVPTPEGIRDEVLRGREFTLEMTCPVEGASIYYNFDGQAPRETDYLYEGPVKIRVPEGEMREVKAIVITPSGKRSNIIRTVYDNRFGTEYNVGAGIASLEPDERLFSTTLAGYGAPAEGRFSIDWKKVGKDEDLSWMETFDDSRFNCQNGPDGAVISSLEYKGRIFGLTGEGTLWRRDQGSDKWTKIGRNNGETWKINVKKIATHNDHLYAVADDGTVYRNFHRTLGNLSARAMAFSRNGNTAVIVGLDLTGVDYAFVCSVKEDLRKATGLGPEAILINASHTHFAPVSQGWYSWTEPNQYPDDRYMEEFVRPAIVNAVKDALSDLHPAHLYFGRTQAFIGGNRCLGWPENVYDPTTDVIEIVSKDGKTENVIFLAGCHPVFNNWGKEGYTISGNWPAEAKRLVERATGTDNAIFLQGCAGDINPLNGDYREMGSILADAVLERMDSEMFTVDGEISFALDSICFATRPWKKADIIKFREDNARYPGDVECDKNVRWADIMLRHYKNGTMPKSMPVYIQTINIGDWKLVGLSREAVTSYGIEIRNIWPNKHVSVIGYTNDVCSYLPALEHIRAHTYEGDNSFLWYSQPNIFPEDVQEQIIATIRKNNR